MLKILKHDIKDSWREIVILNAVLIVLSFFPLLGNAVESNFLFSLGMTAWVLALIACSAVITIGVIKGLNTMLFTDSGYLTLTTPISIDKILISKILVNMLWVLTTTVSIILSVLLFSSAMFGEVMYLLPGAFRLIAENPLGTFLTILIIFSYILFAITMLLFILTLLNVSTNKRYKILKGYLIYWALSSFVGVVNIFIALAILGAGGSFTLFSVVLSLINLVWSVAFYFTGRYLIINKLELE